MSQHPCRWRSRVVSFTLSQSFTERLELTWKVEKPFKPGFGETWNSWRKNCNISGNWTFLLCVLIYDILNNLGWYDFDSNSKSVNLENKSCIRQSLNFCTNADSNSNTKWNRFFFISFFIFNFLGGGEGDLHFFERGQKKEKNRRKKT